MDKIKFDIFWSMKQNVSLWTLSVALAGFLFGFDTVVISGANLPIRELWNTTPLFHGFFIMSMALWGTVIGAFTSGRPTDRYGRKNTLIFIGVLYAVSALGSALAPDPYSFSFFRFIGGLGVGASSVTVPTYLSEISPPRKRGGLVARYQFMIVLGILVAFISNYLLDGVGGSWDWRLMLGVEAIPAFFYIGLVTRVPNSPRWLLIHKNDESAARKVLKDIGVEDVSLSVKAIQSSVMRVGTTRLFTRVYTFPIILAFLIAFFNQLSGINFILYYAPEILERSGLGGKESLLNSIYIGGINIVFTLIGMYLIDRTGRRRLMLIGSLGYILSLSMVAYGFLAGATPYFMLIFILIFISSHAIGQGAVIWVFISEIFPNQVRAAGQSLGAAVHWIFAALITLLTPVFLDETDGVFKENPWPIFAFFAGFMVLQLLFVLFLMPETKGKSLEEIESQYVV